MANEGATETRRDLRRAQIIKAARRIVADGGLGALTFGTLEKELGFTRGVITYHFESKDEIVDALLDDAISEIDRVTSQQVKAESDAGDKVAAAVRGMVQGFLQLEEAGRVLLSFWSRLKDDPRAARKNAALYAGWRKQGADLIRHGQSIGALGPCDVEALAALLVGIVIGTVTQAWFEAGAIDAKGVVEEATQAILARLEPIRYQAEQAAAAAAAAAAQNR